MNVGVREAARQLGLDKSVVSRQVKKFGDQGVLTIGADKKFDLDAYKAARAGALNPLMARNKGGDLGYEVPPAPAAADAHADSAGDGAAPPANLGLLGKAHAADKIYGAQLKQLDLAKKLGKVVDVAGVIAAGADIADAVREGLRTRNRRLAEKAATLNDPNEIEAMLDREDEALLAAVRAELVKRLAPAEDTHAAA